MAPLYRGFGLEPDDVLVWASHRECRPIVDAHRRRVCDVGVRQQRGWGQPDQHGGMDWGATRDDPAIGRHRPDRTCDHFRVCTRAYGWYPNFGGNAPQRAARPLHDLAPT